MCKESLVECGSDDGTQAAHRVCAVLHRFFNGEAEIPNNRKVTGCQNIAVRMKIIII